MTTVNQKQNKRREKALWLVIILLLLAMIAQHCAKTKIHDQVKTGPPGAEEFFSGLLPGAKKDPDTQAPGKIGLAVPAGVVADAEGNAVVTIRNQGDQAAVPVVKYKDREVYRCSRALEPGEAVKVKIPFGPGSGEEKFETTMETSSVNGFGVGMSVVSKVLFQG